jgi:hypothetical protein
VQPGPVSNDANLHIADLWAYDCCPGALYGEIGGHTLGGMSPFILAVGRPALFRREWQPTTRTDLMSLMKRTPDWQCSAAMSSVKRACTRVMFASGSMRNGAGSTRIQRCAGNKPQSSGRWSPAESMHTREETDSTRCRARIHNGGGLGSVHGHELELGTEQLALSPVVDGRCSPSLLE